MNISRKSIVSSIAFALALPLLTWIKVSFIVGTEVGSFSITHCISPLIGIFGGTFGAFFLLAFRTITKYFTATAATPFLLVCHIPTLCSALYLALFYHPEKNHLTPSRTIAQGILSIVPLLCMTLFWAHPVGSQAAPYALFWTIPFLTALIPHNRLILHALGSTFTAHAVGSVLWLYVGLVPNPTTWLSLIPVVVCERLIFSCGMVLCYRFIKVVHYSIKNSVNKLRIPQSNA